MKALRRWLVTDGQMEQCPDWYLTIKVANYLRVAPWELVRQPLFWQAAAQEAMAAEHYAREEHKALGRK